MSIVLQYGATCDECGRFMRPGTLSESAKSSDGSYRRVHAGSCPSGDVSRPISQPKPVKRDVHICPHCRSDWAFDKGAFARGRGRGAPSCPTCQKPWTELYAEIEAGVYG